MIRPVSASISTSSPWLLAQQKTPDRIQVKPAGLTVLDGPVSRLDQLAAPRAYRPDQILAAYRINRVSERGAGQTIAIPTAFHTPSLVEDVRTFSRQFGLPDAQIEVVNLARSPAATRVDPGWSVETAMDAEWAHSAAPGARILVVEAADDSLGSMLKAVDYARRRADVTVVSMSWGTSEFPQQNRLEDVFTTPAGHRGITFVAASGDYGAGVLWPSASSSVLAVGGTSLQADPGRVSETGWSGSGGGLSFYEPEPQYQYSVQNTGRRTTPDVSLAADPATGYYVYQGGQWQVVGGTSAAAPQWAGLIARANEARQRRGQLPLEQAQERLYTLSDRAFRDVVGGSNGYPATRGYDLVTGRGVPVADKLVNELSAHQVTFQLQGDSAAPAYNPYSYILELMNPKKPASNGWWG